MIITKNRISIIGITLLAVFLILGAISSAAASDLIILHTNDIHGRIEIDEEAGQMGFPYIASVVNDYRENHDNVLVLDAGDTIHGQSLTNVFEGESAIKAMNEIGYDVMSPGNHDFNFGYTRLLELEEIMEFDYISTNVVKDGEPILRPYTIKEVGDYKIGIFGITPTYTVGVVRAEHIEGIEFLDMAETAQYYVDKMHEDYDLDLIIGLANSSGAEVAYQLEGIDLFVDGHGHDLYPEGKWRDDVLHVMANEYSRYIGIVQIEFAEELKMTASVMSAEEVMNNYDYNEDIKNLLDDFRGKATEILLGN